MASIASWLVGRCWTPRLSSGAIISRERLAEATALPLKKKSATTRLSRLIKRLTPNTPATAPSFSTGLRPTRRSRLRPSRTSPTPTMPSSSTTRRILKNEWFPPKSPSSQLSINQASSRKTANFCSSAPGLLLWATQRFVSFEPF